MFYTINENFVDNFFKDIYTTKPTKRLHSQFDAEVLDDGKQQVTINTIGHNPKDITVDVTEEEITIKSKKGEDTSRFVQDIDLVLTVGTDYDGTKTTVTIKTDVFIAPDSFFIQTWPMALQRIKELAEAQ